MGGKFYSIHKLTQEIYEELQDGLDVIGEHLRSLDIATPMTVEDLNKAMMEPIPESCFDQDGMIRALAINNNSLAESFNLLAEEAEAMKDQLTLDLAIERGRVHKKFQWLLKSNLGWSMESLLIIFGLTYVGTIALSDCFLNKTKEISGLKIISKYLRHH